MKKKEALELAINAVEGLFDPWYMEILQGEEWVCVLLDGTVKLAGEHQEFNIHNKKDAEKILFKWQVGELVEQYFEFKRKFAIKSH